MKQLRRGGRALASAIILVGILPTAATAGPGHFALPAMHSSEFTLPASNGYRLQVADTGGRQIYLTARNGGSSVIYEVQGRKTEKDGIEARFLGVGRISVRFEQIGKTKHAPPAGNCRGDGSDTRHGVFRGAIVFNGEKGFSRAHASRARGTVHDSGKEICTREKERHGDPGLHTIFLSASAPQGKGLLSFFAAKFSSESIPAADQTTYGASLFQFRGRMGVYRTLSRNATGESFVLGGPSGHPTAASVAPPSPFAGTADLQLDSTSTAKWLGPLSVDLPGFGQVNLAGPKFSAELCLDNRPCYGSSDGHGANFVAVAVSKRERGTLPRAAAPSPRPLPR